MGTDNLFHKRRARKASEPARRKSAKAPYAKVLIVCEGEKTEPYYFEDLKDHYRLNSADIVVTGECGSDPLTVFEHAKRRYLEDKNASDPFDRVYCVFDKDNHAGYDQALRKIQQATPRGTFVAIHSVPCFEYWLLLHFVFSTRPYIAQPDNSAGRQLLTELQGHLLGYHKGSSDVFGELLDRLDTAKQNAARGLEQMQAAGTDNPSTRVHLMVEYLQRINQGVVP